MPVSPCSQRHGDAFLPDFHVVKKAGGGGPLKLKVSEVQYDLHVDLNNDLVNAVPAIGVVVGVVWGAQHPRG